MNSTTYQQMVALANCEHSAADSPARLAAVAPCLPGFRLLILASWAALITHLLH
jgi:hypothetical protein